LVDQLHAALASPRACRAWPRAIATHPDFAAVATPLDAVRALALRDARADRLTVALVALAHGPRDGRWLATLTLTRALIARLARPIRAWPARDDAAATIAVTVVDLLAPRPAETVAPSPATFDDLAREVRRVLDRARPAPWPSAGPPTDDAPFGGAVEPVALHACALAETTRALATLSYRDQALLLAHAVAGIPHADLAFAFRMHPTVVRRRVGRARQRLRDRAADPG
jgi:DNA-directed RNA polymerase specialized sigma24 family protein